jgi:predicted component of type VI protein secretion system
MKESNGAGKPDQKPEDEFEKRAQRILDRLDQADRILDNMQEEKKSDKATDKLEEVFESIERGLKKLFSTAFSEITKPTDGQEQPLVPKRLAQFLQSCSDEQLTAIKDEIDRILIERSST